MKTLILGLFVAGSVMAQATVCESGYVSLIFKKDSQKECFESKIERKLKYRFCDSGDGFLYDDNFPTKRLYLHNGFWNYRIDSIDYSNNKETLTKLLINKGLSEFSYIYHEKTFSREVIKSYSCEGYFQKN